MNLSFLGHDRDFFGVSERLALGEFACLLVVSGLVFGVDDGGVLFFSTTVGFASLDGLATGATAG